MICADIRQAGLQACINACILSKSSRHLLDSLVCHLLIEDLSLI